MSRKPRIHYAGAFYHVMLRGNGGQDIFSSSADRSRFYLLLQEGIEAGKKQPAAKARAVAAYLAQDEAYLSLTDLSEIVRRDLSALSRAAGRIREWAAKDVELSEELRMIKEDLLRRSRSQAWYLSSLTTVKDLPDPFYMIKELRVGNMAENRKIESIGQEQIVKIKTDLVQDFQVKSPPFQGQIDI
jgi:hypothetical protein